MQEIINFFNTLGAGIDKALEGATKLTSKLMVIFFMWLMVAIVLFIIGTIGNYVGGALIAFSVISNIIWFILCVLLGVIETQKYLDTHY